VTLEALVFDVDGTLADTERDGHRVAFNTAFAEVGLDWHWNESLYSALLSVAGGVERMVHYARLRGWTDSDEELHARLRPIHRAKTAHYLRHVASGGISLRPGIARLLGEARAAGLRLAIATTMTRDNVLALLEATLGPDSIHWFASIGTAAEVAIKKPDPAVYRWVLAELGVPASNAIAFEDTRNGLLAAMGAGLRCIVAPTDGGVAEDLTGAMARLVDLDHHPTRPGELVTLDDVRAWATQPG
jgi:HAD superfamily hydrolase (TIGR01509 family)